MNPIHLKISGSGRVCVETPELPEKPERRPADVLQIHQPREKSKPVYTVREGAVCIPIFAQTSSIRSGEKLRRYRSHFFSWSDGAVTHRERRSDLDDAKALARDRAKKILNGQRTMGQYDERDWASYRRALEILEPTKQSLELAASNYADALKKLAGRATLERAVQFFLENEPAGIDPKDTPVIVQELLADLQRAGAGEKWRASLAGMLQRFARSWSGPLHTIRSAEINAWLRALVDKKGKPVGARTRVNHLSALVQLETFGKNNGYLPKTWTEISSIKPPELPEPEIRTIDPDDLVKLLSKAPAKIVPFIALTAFAGIRHEEMCPAKGGARLDWKTINLDRKNIYVPKTVGKEGHRNVPISDNLVAWLRLHHKDSGPVCPLVHASAALLKAKRKAGIRAGRNETRNTLRKSFITYRIAVTRNIAATADEAGNSAEVIKSNYMAALEMPDDLARRWFSIIPQDTKGLPLFDWKR